jgi:hypothetical protein
VPVPISSSNRRVVLPCFILLSLRSCYLRAVFELLRLRDFLKINLEQTVRIHKNNCQCKRVNLQMSGHFHKYFTYKNIGILCLVPLSQQIYQQIKQRDVSRQALSTSSDKERTVVFYARFEVFTVLTLKVLVF